MPDGCAVYSTVPTTKSLHQPAENISAANDIYIIYNDSAYVIGYWVNPCHDKKYLGVIWRLSMPTTY